MCATPTRIKVPCAPCDGLYIESVKASSKGPDPGSLRMPSEKGARNKAIVAISTAGIPVASPGLENVRDYHEIQLDVCVNPRCVLSVLGRLVASS